MLHGLESVKMDQKSLLLWYGHTLAVGELVPGPFKPTCESLKAYKCPELYQDAKLGLWAHWGPQRANRDR
jgi:hypothetical protein